MKQFDEYRVLKILINRCKNSDVQFMLNCYLSPLYLFLLELNQTTKEGHRKVNSIYKIIRKFKILLYHFKNFLKDWITEFSTQKYRVKKNIIFWPVEPSHLNQMIPVAKKMKKNDYIFATNKRVIYKKLLLESIPCIFLSTRCLFFGKSKTNPSSKELVSLLCTEGFFLKKAEQFIKYFNLFYELKSKKIFKIFEEIFKKISPKLIIVGNDITVEGRMAVFVAKQYGIKSACIQHGAIVPPLEQDRIADHFIIYGKTAQETFIKLGIPNEKLAPLGAPYLDKVDFKNKEMNPDIKEKLGLTKERPYILVALSGYGHSTSLDHFNEIVESVFRLTKKMHEFDFIFKLHRKDKIQNYSDLLTKLKPNVKIIENGSNGYPQDVFEWLRGCRLLITGASTVAIEAMLFECPVMTIDYFSEYKEIDFIKSGATIHITDKNELEHQIKRAICDPASFGEVKERASLFSKFYFNEVNGFASDRVAKYFESLI